MSSQSIITFQIPTTIKKKLINKVRKSGRTLSEYLRDLVNQDTNFDNKSSIATNPWLELADNVRSVMNEAEIDSMFANIQSARANRSQESWDKIVQN